MTRFELFLEVLGSLVGALCLFGSFFLCLVIAYALVG